LLVAILLEVSTHARPVQLDGAVAETRCLVMLANAFTALEEAPR